MLKCPRALAAAVFMLTAICTAIPAWVETRVLTPDDGKWTVEINAEAANVSISGIESPYSTVQVTVQYINPDNLSEENSLPVNVFPVITVKITPQQPGFQVRSITFECTKGKVQITAVPADGSGGPSADWW